MKQITLILLTSFLSFGAMAQYTNKKIEIGQKAPELAFENTNGKVIKLSKINKKRLVLIDFWASWCGPCRMSNPGLVKFYEEYKDKKYVNAPKGLTILSVSLDQKRDKWIAAIQKDNLDWPYHMSDLGGWKSEPGQIYGVQFVPQCFLVDGNGVIIGKYTRAEQCIADLKNLMEQ